MSKLLIPKDAKLRGKPIPKWAYLPAPEKEQIHPVPRARKSTHATPSEPLEGQVLLNLRKRARRGIAAKTFFGDISKESPFDLNEWSQFLDTSVQTLELHRKQGKKFNFSISERILQILMLNRMGIEVFGSPNEFHAWTKRKNITLGGVTPEALMDSTFGIRMVHDQLGRIAYGIVS